MATFFDTTTKSDVDKLHHAIRNHPDLSRVIDETEDDILNRFTVRTGVNQYRVDLEGYDDDNPSDSHSSLQTVLKRAIAEVASYRLRMIDANPNAVSETLMDYEYDRGGGAGRAELKWPQGWDERLRKFYDETEPLYTI